jgi:hypothetical protein
MLPILSYEKKIFIGIEITKNLLNQNLFIKKVNVENLIN